MSGCVQIQRFQRALPVHESESLAEHLQHEIDLVQKEATLPILEVRHEPTADAGQKRELGLRESIRLAPPADEFSQGRGRSGGHPVPVREHGG